MFQRLRKRNKISVIISRICLIIVAICLISTMYITRVNAAQDGDFDDIFSDRVEEEGLVSYKTFIGYDFSLEEYGSMKVYLDTSNGHTFELNQEYGGFDILDQDGNLSLRVLNLADAYYEQATEGIEESKTINGREFLYDQNEQGVIHAFSHMADVGINLGFALETEEEDNLSLVAFRGEPFEEE